MFKKSYYQGGGGVNQPQKYKVEKAIVVQPRFEEPFYRNYDLYDVPGISDSPQYGPGAGWNSMHKYKSIADYLNYTRQILKDKYKARDSYIEDTEQNYNDRVNKMQIRTAKLKKLAIDFAFDQQVEDPVAVVNDTSAGHSTGFGGMFDPYVVQYDFEGKTPEQLNFGRDYQDEETFDPKLLILDKLIGKYLTPAETALYGMPAGIEPISDLDADKTVNDNPFNRSNIPKGTYSE